MSKIWEDKIIRLLFLNILLVILSYAFAVMTGMASNAIMTPFRTLVLLFSIYYTFKKLTPLDFHVLKNELYSLFLFIGMIVFLLLFSQDFFRTIERTSQFVVPFAYIFLVSMYFIKAYSKEDIWYYFLVMINITYLIPVISYLLGDGGLGAKNIYGTEEDGAFASNHYGWASLLFILTFYDLNKNYTLPKWHRWTGMIMLLPAFFLLLVSGNRASYLCFAISSVVFLLRHNTVNIFFRISLVALVSFYVYDQLSDEQTALSARLKRTELQLQDDEEYADTRRTARETGIDVMDKHPETYLTGFGLFSFKEAVIAFEPSTSYARIKSGVHNSYLELFFGSGIIVFAFFMCVYIFYPLGIYIVQYSDRFLFVLPVFIIPFFESNLTGGQFLFYPWLVTAMLFRFVK